MAKIRRKYGMVILLDALGAANYTEAQIKTFLSARAKINSWMHHLAANGPSKQTYIKPTIYTFADTIIITVSLSSKKHIHTHLWTTIFLMRRYLFHSIEEGILFRGAFSIGHYIEDAGSNTVMGPAVSDAAAWYEQSEWIGLSSTPKTNSALEYYASPKSPTSRYSYLHKYDVPMKGGATLNLYTVSWPSAFFDKTLLKEAKKSHPRRYFLEILKGFHIPKGVETKFKNAKDYFSFVETEIANEAATGDGK